MHTLAQKPKTTQQNTVAKSTMSGRRHIGHSLEESSIFQSQHTIGDQAVQRRLNIHTGDVKGDQETTQGYRFGHDLSQIQVSSKSPLKIQTKLTVSTPGDRYEQEADQIADSVMSGYPLPVRHISQGVQPKLYRVVMRPEALGMRPEDLVDSRPPSGEEVGAKTPVSSPIEEVQRSATGDAGAVTPHFEQSLQQASHGGGEALPSSSRSFMESRFGYDFSSVRVHSDARAHTLAREVNARAFTLDKDIFFARSQYQPESHEGQRLLAHELAHVIQQNDGRLSRQIQRQTSCSSYNGYNSSVNLLTYNCAGLATRTYQDISPPSAVYDSIVANLINAESPGEGKCDAGAVKFWLWEYDVHLEDDQGNATPARRDFHVVAGRTDANGADPTNVYSKNGHRRVYGPGTGPGFRPASRERALSNDPSETPGTSPQGRPIFKVRSNMSEAISCAECYPFRP